MDKKVSIIMPVYNTGEFLNRCLDSIFRQTYKNFELICVDDKSTDNSVDIIENYVDKHQNIKVIKINEHKGQSFCKNIALQQVTGDYISFIDSDDFVSDNFIETMVNLAVQNNADIIMSDLLFEDRYTNQYYSTLETEGIYQTLYDKLTIIKNGSCCDKLFSLHIINKNEITFPTGLFYEDNEFLLKTVYYANKICTTKNSSYFYCYNEKSTTRSKVNQLELKKSASILLERILSFFNSKKITTREYKQLIEFCLKSFCNVHIGDKDFMLPNSLNLKKRIYLKFRFFIYKKFFK